MQLTRLYDDSIGKDHYLLKNKTSINKNEIEFILNLWIKYQPINKVIIFHLSSEFGISLIFSTKFLASPSTALK
jgi:hypothetical protein